MTDEIPELPRGIEGANHTVRTLTWSYENGDPVDLTGATLTGKKKNQTTGTTTDISGPLNVLNPVDGTFTWAINDTDVAARGAFIVQFIATFADTTKEKTMKAKWVVEDALDV